MSDIDFSLQGQVKSGDVTEYLKEIEFRTTLYLRGFVSRVAENYQKQITGRYKKIKEENAKIIGDNVEAVFIDSKVVPKKKKGGGKRPITKQVEEHYAAVVTHAVKVDAKAKDKNRTLVKVVANRRGFKQSSAGVFTLVRFGPWHFDQLPFVPKKGEATILFTEVDPEQATAIKKKNQRNRKKVQVILKKSKVKIMSRIQVMNDLDGFDDLEYWVLRKEFGLDGRKASVWKPALKYITSEGFKKIMKDVELHKTLFDPKFKNYKNIDKGYNIVDDEVATGLIKFQNKIRG